jgi:hemerythrin superfamily protein
MAGNSVVELLLQDHQEVKASFTSFETADRSKWWDMFQDLVGDLVRHEVAEEEIVFPEARKVLPNGDAIVDARIGEQSEAEELLSKMEKGGPNDPNFAANLTHLREAVLMHAESEEQTVFQPMAQALDAERLEKLGNRYAKAKAIAPTHPHPHAPDTPPGNMALGPVAALADRIRDAVRKSG